MKINKKRNHIDASDNNNTIGNTEYSANQSNLSIIIIILPILSMVAVALSGICKNTAGTDIIKQGIITLILSGAATFLIRFNAESIFNKKLAKTLIVLGYLGSIGLLFFVPEPEVYSFWMLGGLIIAMLIDNKLGLMFDFNLTLIMGIAMDIQLELVVQILIICFLMTILANALKNIATVIYAAIIILSVNITLAFAINNFNLNKMTNYNYVFSLFSILAVLAIAFFLSFLYQKFIDTEEKTIAKEQAEISIASMESELTSMQVNVDDNRDTVQSENTSKQKELSAQENIVTDFENVDIHHNIGTRTSYEILCDMDNKLMEQLKQYSENLFLHSVIIGDLSSRAAAKIGANDLLAKAGGLYHEIGKMNGKNYIEENLKIAEDYAFPKDLKAILKEHNIKYDNPNSVEAAIVMLSDNVVSTIDYIKKTDDHKYTTNKIIENIFQMRMEKGTFDSSGISLKDFKTLKEFYQQEFNKQEESAS